MKSNRHTNTTEDYPNRVNPWKQSVRNRGLCTVAMWDGDRLYFCWTFFNCSSDTMPVADNGGCHVRCYFLEAFENLVSKTLQHAARRSWTWVRPFAALKPSALCPEPLQSQRVAKWVLLPYLRPPCRCTWQPSPPRRRPCWRKGTDPWSRGWSSPGQLPRSQTAVAEGEEDSEWVKRWVSEKKRILKRFFLWNMEKSIIII